MHPVYDNVRSWAILGVAKQGITLRKNDHYSLSREFQAEKPYQELKKTYI